MQIKTTMRYYLTLIRMAAIKMSANNECWRGCGEKESILRCWWECKLVEPLWRIVWRFLKKLEIELPCDPAILLSIYTKEARIERNTCTPVFLPGESQGWWRLMGCHLWGRTEADTTEVT